MNYQEEKIKIDVGKYAGTEIQKLPNSYLRWMLTQNFPKEWLEIAKNKLKESEFNDEHINVSRHALDMYSKRFLKKWIDQTNGADPQGFATFVALEAKRAWVWGKDISKQRHQDDGIIKEFEGVKWVFGANSDYLDYCSVITVMSDVDEENRVIHSYL